jgi:hypothetical protein
MTHTLAYSLTFIVCGPVTARGRCSPPTHLVLDGVGILPLVAHARRTHLLDAVETYAVTVYINGSLDRTPCCGGPTIVAPANAAINEWGHRGTPSDWETWRLRRESGHTVGFVLPWDFLCWC